MIVPTEQQLLEPTSYTDHAPSAGNAQDVVDVARVASLLTARVAGRGTADALAYAQTQAAHETQDWTGMCLAFVRTCVDVPPLYATAYLAWLGVEDIDKHAGGNIDDAPAGSALYFKGSNPAGHIELAGRPFASGTSGGWSNDLVTYGQINKVARTAAETKWGQRFLGWSEEVNGYDLRLPVPKPKQDKPYKAIAKSIDRLGVALDTAKSQHDTHDVTVLEAELGRLKKLHDTLRRY